MAALSSRGWIMCSGGSQGNPFLSRNVHRFQGFAVSRPGLRWGQRASLSRAGVSIIA